MQEPSRSSSHARPTRVAMLRVALAGVLGIAVALLVACGSSGSGLIPAGNAGPLQSDFEAIAQAAQTGNGSCAATEAAILKTEHDFHTLPANVDSGLRRTLAQGIANLRGRALGLCTQPLQQPTVTSTTTSTQTTTSSATTPTATQTTPTQTTPTTTPTTPTTTGPGGGTAAPNGEPAPGGQGGTEPGAGSGGAGGQEGGK